MKLFVYGTLLRGESNADKLMGSRYLGLALMGGKLYDAGVFPYLTLGDGQVVGEVWEVDDTTLVQIDRLEGYRPDKPEVSFYTRASGVARWLANGEYAQVDTYWLDAPDTEENLIAHGDYRRFKSERTKRNIYIAAYGSNASLERLEDRIGSVRQRLVGWLPDFELVFNKDEGNGVHAYANIRHAEGEKCSCFVQSVSAMQLALLDVFEGVDSQHYLRVGLPIHLHHMGESSVAQVWIAHPDQLVPERRPSVAYLQHIEQGAYSTDRDR